MTLPVADYARELRRLFNLLEVAQLRGDRCAELIVIGRIRALRAVRGRERGMTRPLTATEVAELLGVHLQTVKRLAPAELPYFRVGSRGDRRYERDDVARYMARRRVAA